MCNGLCILSYLVSIVSHKTTRQSEPNQIMSGSASLALFQKTLQDVVKGIRSQHKRGDPAAFISETFAEIKTELKSTDVFVKVA